MPPLLLLTIFGRRGGHLECYPLMLDKNYASSPSELDKTVKRRFHSFPGFLHFQYLCHLILRPASETITSSRWLARTFIPLYKVSKRVPYIWLAMIVTTKNSSAVLALPNLLRHSKNPIWFRKAKQIIIPRSERSERSGI